MDPSVENMTGVLYDDPRQPTADEEEASFLGRLVGNFKSPPKEEEVKPTGGLRISLQANSSSDEE